MFGIFGRTVDLARTLVHDLMFLILGLMMSISGPTLLDLKQLVGTDSYGISLIFTARSIGYLLGATTGGIVLDCLKNEDMALIVSSSFVAFGAYAIPWSRSLPVLLGIFAITGFAMGFCNTGSNASILRTWGKKGAPFIQCLHFAYGFGGFLGPLLAANFLSAHTPEAIALPLVPVPSTTEFPTVDLLPDTGDNILVSIHKSIPSITYAYTIIGAAATFVCGCFIFVFVFGSEEGRSNNTDEQAGTRDPGLSFTVLVVVLACLQTGLVSGIEVSFTQMLTSYVVKSDHGLTKVAGSYMTSVYWGCFTCMRLVSILLSCKVNVKRMLMFDLVLALFANIVLLTVGTWSVEGLWVGTAMLGIGVASIFPATLSWVEKYININNKIASAFTLVSSILEMTVPLTVSIYLDTHPNVLFTFMTSAIVSVVCIFIVLNLLFNRKGEKYEDPKKIEKPVPAATFV